jgi:hypothetical protein
MKEDQQSSARSDIVGTAETSSFKQIIRDVENLVFTSSYKG